MYQNKVGILPVVDNDQLYGVITDRDVFAAFLHVSGYGENGVRVRCVVEDKKGVLSDILHIISDQGYNVVSTVQIADQKGQAVIEVQLDGAADIPALTEELTRSGFKVDSIVPTIAKKI